MKSTGIVRRVDSLGRIVVPKELRRILHMDSNQSVEIYLEDEAIVLQRYNPGCVFCGSDDVVSEIHGELVCRDCVQALLESVEPEEQKEQDEDLKVS